MEASQWHESNQAVLMAAVDVVRQRFLGEPDTDAVSTWQKAEDDLSGRSRLQTLVETFQLTDFELQVILLCAGFELDPRIGVIASGEKPAFPTFHHLLQKLPNSHWRATAPDAPLRYWQLVTLEEPNRFLHSRLQLDERILHYLMGSPAFPQSLRGLLERVPVPATITPSQNDTAGKIVRLHKTRRSERVPVLVLNGKDRLSTRAVAAYAYHQLNLQTFTLHAADLPTNTRERLHLLRLIERESLLNPSALFIDAHDLAENRMSQVSAFASQFKGLLTVATSHPLTGITRANVQLELTRPTVDERAGLWQQALGSLAAPLNGGMTRLAREFNLEAGSIQMLGARLQSELSPETKDPALIEGRLRELCSAQAQPQLDALCQRIESRAVWDDLVLPDQQKRILQEIVVHVYRRFQVYYDWGFAQQNNRGLGISALFAGESGTGKTLAAEIIANRLRLPLYRIELSAVVSKYIGETEKNLARIFDAGEAMGAVLLFDEADALFGKRSEVKDAHDRYANIEVSYLLQRMEAYRGLAILTTNFKRNLDSAFLRRLRFVVQFPFPGLADRALIWERIFPPGTPLDALDYQKLAQLNIAGGHIKNIAMLAAFHAADSEEPVTIKHILRATRGEYHKLEKPLTSAEIKGWTV